MVRYDDVLDCVGGALTSTDRDSMLMSLGGNGTQCVLDIQIEKYMKAPTYIYYELHNYYQNHRRCATQRTRWYRDVSQRALHSQTRWRDMQISHPAWCACLLPPRRLSRSAPSLMERCVQTVQPFGGPACALTR